MAKLKEKYEKEILPRLAKEWKLPNLLAVPRLVKVVINLSSSQMVKDRGYVERLSQELALISGQKPKVCPAKKSIAGFRLAQGDPIGLKVTLRRQRMYDFLEKLIKVALPRVKDFQGLDPKSFDGYGNYNLGLTEQIVFPEVDYGKIDKVRGLEITIVTSTNSDKRAQRLLEELGMPFKKPKTKNKSGI